MSWLRFQPGEGPSRGLFSDCEIFVNIRLAFVASSKGQAWCQGCRLLKIPMTGHLPLVWATWHRVAMSRSAILCTGTRRVAVDR